MSVWYLDPEDEITDAVARFRATQDGAVILVVPPGSRIASGGINFRLLAREAETRGLALGLVSGDPQVRALATSAGLGAWGTVGEAERALGLEPSGTPPEGRDDRADRLVPAYGVAPRTATGAAGDGVVPVAVPVTRETRRSLRRGGGRGRVLAWAIRGALVGGLAAVGLWVAYQAIPTADVVLVPGTTQLPPRTVRIVATPDSPEVDAEAGTIPAEWRQYPLAVTGAFPATGTEDRSTAATGRVRLVSQNTVVAVVVGDGTRVSTNSGIVFRTVGQVALPKWDGNGPRPAVEVEIRAVKRGPAANTGAETITRIEKGYEAQQVKVTNPEAVTDGARELIRQVTNEDCDAAVETLRGRLREAFATELAAPPSAGMILYPESGRLGEIDLSVSCPELVGTSVPGDIFEITAGTTATALEVDTSVLEETAARHFRVTADPGMRVEAGSIEAIAGEEPEVTPDTVTYPVEVTARVQLAVDPAQIRREIAGRSVSDAREILGRYGEATLTLWPEFIPTVPADPARIGFEIP
ncbi:MAG: hypothetical protein ACKOTZ_00705 [Chloroflexota bacterium]